VNTFCVPGGFGNDSNKISLSHAAALHPGDEAAIPEPVSVVLLLAALGVLGAMARQPR